MNRRRQLVLIALSVVILASLASHLVVRVLGIQTAPRLIERGGIESDATPICVAGSSLIYYGLEWDQISKAVGRPINKCGVPGASPSELEQVVAGVTSDLTVVGVSLYDLNEHLLSDFRSEFVPFTTTIRDLTSCDADWAFAKRLVGNYALTFVRTLYPTAGRSLGVMVGVRRQMREWLGKGGADVETGPTFDRKGFPTERIDTWPEGRTMRNLSQVHAGCQGRWSFDGPKHLAFGRLLARAAQRGNVLVVVLPVSPPFLKEFGSEPVRQHFENALADARKNNPKVEWIRIDEMPSLQSSRYYWDLVHLNAEGQGLATPVVLERLKAMLGSQ